MFSGGTVLPDSKETEHGITNQEASPSAGKNTRVVLVPCYTWKCVLKAISSGVDISLGVICYDRLVFREGHKNYFKDWCLMKSRSNFSAFDRLLTH